MLTTQTRQRLNNRCQKTKVSMSLGYTQMTDNKSISIELHLLF